MERKNPSELFFYNSFRTKVSNKIKVNHFNNVEQNTSKRLGNIFVVLQKDNNTVVVIAVVVLIIKHLILSLWVKILIYDNHQYFRYGIFGIVVVIR